MAAEPRVTRMRLLAVPLVCLLVVAALLLAWPSAPLTQTTGAAPGPPHGAAAAAPVCACAPATSGCCCSAADLEDTNKQIVYPLLKRVVATPFFSHFRINLCSDCGLWKDSPLCVLRDCGVCECEEPPAWAAVADAECDGPQVEQQVVPRVDQKFLWDEPGRGPAEGQADDAVVVDLRLNPERYTGYSGPSAERVWEEIHGRNAFQESEESNGTAASGLTAEQRLYNELLSGIHSSISLHIAHDYCLRRSATNAFECAAWGPNATLAHERVLQHADRLQNLYTTFGVLLRAVVKAGDAVSAAVPQHDAAFADALREWRASLLPQLRRLASECPQTFAEEAHFAAGDGGGAAWRQLDARLRHLGEIMKCVGCDRCKLWGTLQARGLSVALRVLFQEAAGGGKPELSRQDAVALVHTLERLSSSLKYAQELRSPLLVSPGLTF